MQKGNTVKSLLVFCSIVMIVMACNAGDMNKFELNVGLSTNSSCREDCCNIQPPRPPMTYYYYQNTGKFIGGVGNYSINTYGYSGQGKGYMNPDYQCVSGTDAGPLPASTYLVAFCKNMMH
jgi:hypothetical protein